MTRPGGATLFGDAAWSQALQKFGEVTRLTVVVYGPDGQVVRDPIHATPLFDLFRSTGYEPGIFADCARQCLLQIADRPAVVASPSYGLAVVGTSLVLDGKTVGAAVAGYSFVDFCQTSAVELLARQASVSFERVWSVARVTAPVPERRLFVLGELLQVLGDSILRENHRTLQYEEKSAELVAAAASKDEFLAVVSHELRTPLSPILLRAQMLHGERDPKRIDHAAVVIERNVRLQARLVEDLLDVTRATRGAIRLALQTRDLRQEVRLAVDSAVETARERQIGLCLVMEEEAVPVAIDPDRLQQVLHNIIGNGLKFTPSGGTITVTVGRQDGSGSVSIVDTGRGIAPEFLPFIFEMFRREDRDMESRRSGLGIGLALVQRLVELHGGDIKVSSGGAERGTEVLVRLPLVSAAPVEPTSDGAEERDAAKLAGRRILIVEDAVDVRESLHATLAAWGADVRVASDGVGALATIARYQPHVVLCDLQMPRMDGFEFIRRLHTARDGHRPPVIAVTGAGLGVSRERTQAAGFTTHLDKPVDERALLLAIEAVLAA